MTFEDMLNLPEPYKSAHLTLILLQWDLEHWEMYLYHAERGEINATPEQIQEEIPIYKEKILYYKNRIDEHKTQYAEYLL